MNPTDVERLALGGKMRIGVSIVVLRAGPMNMSLGVTVALHLGSLMTDVGMLPLVPSNRLLVLSVACSILLTYVVRSPL